MQKLDILNYDRSSLEKELSENFNLQPFRARQLISWLYKKRLSNFEEMTDISKEVRALLENNFKISRPKVVTIQKSVDGTRKYLFEVSDGE